MQIDKLFRMLAGARPRLQAIQGLVATGFAGTWVALVDGAAIDINAALGNFFSFTAATNGVREFSAPTNSVSGDTLRVVISNTSGGALMNTTFAAAIKQPAITYPATGFKREYVLVNDGVNVSLMGFSAADVPN